MWIHGYYISVNPHKNCLKDCLLILYIIACIIQELKESNLFTTAPSTHS